jgi:hypothetical protein
MLNYQRVGPNDLPCKELEKLILHTQFEGSTETICQMCEAFLECFHLPKFLCPHSEHNKHALLQENVPMVQEIFQKIGATGQKYGVQRLLKNDQNLCLGLKFSPSKLSFANTDHQSSKTVQQ